MSDFHKWRKQYQQGVWPNTPLTEIQWSMADLELCWQAATKQERGRCFEAVNTSLDEIGIFEDVEADIGSWDVRRHCLAAIKEID
ncbi:MAG: hypothetical protein ACXADF_15005 [Candidatus Thorarchaeota archaeon]|jgi:hypothetical protein